MDLGWGIWTAFRLGEGAFWSLLGLPGGILKLGLQNEPRMGYLNGFLAWGRGCLSINGAVWANVEAWLAKKAISMPPGMFSQERCLLLSNQNSILMTLNLSGIWSWAVTSWHGCYIVLAIVNKQRTKDKWWQRYAVKCSLTEVTTRSASLILLASSVVRCACPSIPCALVVVFVVACSNAFFCILALWHVWPVFSSFQSIFLLTCNFFSVLVFLACLGSFKSAFTQPCCVRIMVTQFTAFPSYLSFLIPLTFSVWWVPVFFPCAWELMAGLPGFTIHRAPGHLRHPTSPSWAVVIVNPTKPLQNC